MAYWRLFYHVVWGTKHRAALIELEWEPTLYNVIAAKATALGAQLYAIGGVGDHVHVVASIPPSIALSAFIGQLKGNSSHFVNRTLGLPHPFAWQGEFGVVSFGGKHLGTVCRYVQNQREHHRDRRLIALLEQTE